VDANLFCSGHEGYYVMLNFLSFYAATTAIVNFIAAFLEEFFSTIMLVLVLCLSTLAVMVEVALKFRIFGRHILATFQKSGTRSRSRFNAIDTFKSGVELWGPAP
jgi:hypothetical protein